MFGRLLAEHIGGTLSEDDLPLPVTEVRAPALRTLRRTLYSLGSQLVHLAQARF
jgi:hypothetical protein